jgi:UPF0716 family protein affecting phage T7 exclusion
MSAVASIADHISERPNLQSRALALAASLVAVPQMTTQTWHLALVVPSTYSAATAFLAARAQWQEAPTGRSEQAAANFSRLQMARVNRGVCIYKSVSFP